MSIKLFTMVKDEVDIIDYWIMYHGKLFGYENLFIVDNMSTDGTFEKINSYKNRGIHIFREQDYKRKGEIMTNLIKSVGSYDIAFPLDIDEFIVYYDETKNVIDPCYSVEYLNNLIKTDLFKQNTVFKANYIISLIHENNGYGFKDAMIETKYGSYSDYKQQAKTFLNKNNWTGNLDHGNHYSVKDYIKSDLCLIHYHHRNNDQIKKKTENNVLGLGHKIDVNYLKTLGNCAGRHHVQRMIYILENPDSLFVPIHSTRHEKDISLQPMIDCVKEFNIKL